MVISFKLERTGKIYRPKPVVDTESSSDGDNEDAKTFQDYGSSSSRKLEVDVTKASEDEPGASSSFMSDEEVSFTLNIFQDGYSIGEPSETDSAIQDPPKSLLPYDRAAENLFSAIECGVLPGDILDGIPCKFKNGTVACEVRDYREYATSTNKLPVTYRVRLRMTLENIVRDIQLLADDSWTYGDFLEVESRIIKALHPKLDLDPTPDFDKLSKSPMGIKLNVDFGSLFRKRSRQAQDVAATSDNRNHGKKVCTDQVFQKTNISCWVSVTVPGDARPQSDQEDQVAQNSCTNKPLALNSGTVASNCSNLPSAMQDQDMRLSISSNVNNTVGSLPMGPEGIQPQQIMPPYSGVICMPNRIGNNPALQPQEMAREIHNYPSPAFSRVMNQNFGLPPPSTGYPSTRFHPNELPQTQKPDGSGTDQSKNETQIMESDLGNLNQQLSHPTNHGRNETQRMKTDLGNTNPQQSHPDQTLAPVVMSSHFPQLAPNDLSQEPQRRPTRRRRKSVQTQLSSQQGEYTTGFGGTQVGALAATTINGQLSSQYGGYTSSLGEIQVVALAATTINGQLQKEKAVVNDGTPSFTFNANDPLLRQYQPPVAAPSRRSSRRQKRSAISAFGCPGSVNNNINVPLNAKSPTVRASPMGDKTLLARFSKIEMVTARHQLNIKKKKVDNYQVMNPKKYLHENISHCLKESVNFDDDDSMELSKSLVGGNMNICKMKMVNFVIPEEKVQAGDDFFAPRLWTRMFMIQKQNGSMAVLYGDLPNGDVLSVEDTLSTLPNTHFADLLAAQHCALMIREGYNVESIIEPKPTYESFDASSCLSTNADIWHSDSALQFQQNNDACGRQSSNEMAPAFCVATAVRPSPDLLLNSEMSQGTIPGVLKPARHAGTSDNNSAFQLQQHNQADIPQTSNALPTTVDAAPNPYHNLLPNSRMPGGIPIHAKYDGTAHDNSTFNKVGPGHPFNEVGPLVNATTKPLQNQVVNSKISQDVLSGLLINARYAGTLNNKSAVHVSNDVLPGQSSTEVQPTFNVDAATGSAQNLPESSKMSQGVSVHTRSKQVEQQTTTKPPKLRQLHQQSQPAFLQQQSSPFQRSPAVLPSDPILHRKSLEQNQSMSSGGQMVNNNPSSSHFQLLQQKLSEQQIQQLSQLQQRNMLTGIGTKMGTGNMSSKRTRLGGLGTGGAQGLMALIPSSNGSPINSNITGLLSRPVSYGHLTPAQKALLTTRLNMAQNQTNVSEGPSRSSVTGSTRSSRQLLPGSCLNFPMFSQFLNQGNVSQVQQGPTEPRAPPNLMGGGHLHFIRQEQQQQQQRGHLLVQMSQPITISPQLSSGVICAATDGLNHEVSGASSMVNSQIPGSTGSSKKY